MDDLEGVLDDAHGHQLLAVVASVHHHRVGQTFHNGTLGLPETLGGVTSSRVRQVLGILLFHSNVILQQTEMPLKAAAHSNMCSVVRVGSVSQLVIGWAMRDYSQ